MVKSKKGKSISTTHILVLAAVIPALIISITFLTGYTNVPEMMVDFDNDTINPEANSNLEVSITVEPPIKTEKYSSFIFEFNICNNGTKGEEYNYSLELNNIDIIGGESEKNNKGILHDGQACKEIMYNLHTERITSYYSDIDLSIKVYSDSLKKLLFEKTYKYSLNDESLYELQ